MTFITATPECLATEEIEVIGKAYHFDGLCCMVEDMRNDYTVNTDGSITDGNNERLNLFWWADTECFKLGRKIIVEDANHKYGTTHRLDDKFDNFFLAPMFPEATSEDFNALTKVHAELCFAITESYGIWG